MRTVTAKERAQLWEEVRKEFPDDDTMQQVHYVRLLHYLQTKDLAPQKRLRFFGRGTKKAQV